MAAVVDRLLTWSVICPHVGSNISSSCSTLIGGIATLYFLGACWRNYGTYVWRIRVTAEIPPGSRKSLMAPMEFANFTTLTFFPFNIQLKSGNIFRKSLSFNWSHELCSERISLSLYVSFAMFIKPTGKRDTIATCYIFY